MIVVSKRKRGAIINGIVLDLDAFCTWLCEREHEVVGSSGIWFNDPLSIWISQLVGRVYGVDAGRYGSALVDPCRWLWLPIWARWLDARLTQDAKRVMTGAEVLAVLADIEQRFGAHYLWSEIS